MRVAIDAMGGDHAPAEIVRGALLGAAAWGAEVLLVGDAARIEPLLPSPRPPGVEVVHAPGAIPMDAPPIEAVKRGKDASIVVAARLVKEGKADALVSAGSTGAAMAAALLTWGRIRGIDRPAIGTVLPTLNGACIILDVGANVDCRPGHLVHFGLMGTVYAERVLGISNPRVGLLNIGEEATKGNDLALEAYPRLAGSGFRFVGNVEGRDILPGRADVVVCDGFVGNVVLKFGEGMAHVLFDLIRQAVHRDWRSRLGGYLLRGALRDVYRRMDYTEYGGAPLLGVQGVCIISHGASNAKAVKNAVRAAVEAAGQNLVRAIEELASHPAARNGAARE